MSDGAEGTGPSSGDDERDAARHASDDDGGAGRHAASDEGAERAESTAAGSPGQGGVHGAYAVETPEELLGGVAAVRRQTRLARHAYWFPLVLFGLLHVRVDPFYIQHLPARPGVYKNPGSAGPAFLRSDYLGAFGIPPNVYMGYYWLAAILIGVAATAMWYRWRGNRVGLRTPARGYVITVAAGFLALSLVASLCDIENVIYKLGWSLSPAVNGLPNVVLPALALLLSGAGAWAVQRRRRMRPVSPADAEAS